MNEAFHKIKLLGVGITNASEDLILEYLVQNLQKSTTKLFIVTPNPEILVIANKNPSFKNVLNSADLALADGVGITLGARLSGFSLKQRVTGVDFMEKVCERVAKQPITVGFLGGRENVAEIAADCLKRRSPGLKVAFAASSLASAKNLKCDMLFVAFGAPHQEEWIAQNLPKIPVKAAMGVGGAFDYISGSVPRAPKLLRNVGFEWLFRLILQPWRLKRQTRLLKFIYLILSQSHS